MPPAPTYVDSSHNILFKLEKTPAKWDEDYEKSSAGDITGYQEVGSKAARARLQTFCKDAGRGLYMPEDTTNPISWNKEMFRPVRNAGKSFNGVTFVHRGGPAMGIPVRLAPFRDFAYVGLVHKETSKKILRINVHAIAGATKPESSPDARYHGDLANNWADWSLGQYYLDVIAFTAAQLSLQDRGVKNMTNFWDVISIGGDYNAELDRTERWYYPGAMLPALYRPDKIENGLDHLQTTHTSDTVDGKRWSVKGNTDHRIHFVRRQLRNVGDFPRQK